MKTVFLVYIVSTIFFDQISLAQSVNFDKQIIYKMTYQKDSIDLKSTEIEIMELIMSDSVNIFQSVKTGKKDSIESYGKRFDKYFNLSPEQISDLRTPIKYSIYKFRTNSVIMKENITYLPASELNTKFYEDKPTLEWELSNDTLTIFGLSCQKALLPYKGRLWTVWFTTEIPIEEGPYKFKGLPGLIVKMFDRSKTWSFELLEIKPITRIVSIPSHNIIKKSQLSKDEFYKQKRYQIENNTIIRESNGHLAFKDETVRKIMIERDKKNAQLDNNWIELYP